MALRGTRAYEPQSVRLAQAAVTPGMLALDVGANVGFFTLLLSRRAGPTGRVLAFEPDLANLSMLRRNVAINQCGNVEVCALALGNENGFASFMRDEKTGLEGHLVAGQHGWQDASSPAGPIVETRVSTIDAELAGRDRPVAFIKLDVEGSEAAVLRGGEHTIRRDRPVILAELSSSFRDVASGSIERAATTWLFERGYLLFDIELGKSMTARDPAWMTLAVHGDRQTELRELIRLATQSP